MPLGQLFTPSPVSCGRGLRSPSPQAEPWEQLNRRACLAMSPQASPFNVKCGTGVPSLLTPEHSHLCPRPSWEFGGKQSQSYI